MSVVEGKAVVRAAIDRKNASPEVTNEMVAAVFEA
jgi:hypothetical protein